MDLRMGYVLGGGSGPSAAAMVTFPDSSSARNSHLLLSEEMRFILNYIQQSMTSFL